MIEQRLPRVFVAAAGVCLLCLAAAPAAAQPGAAKRMSSSNPGGVPATITIEYLFQNYSASDTVTLVSASDDLAAVFAVHGVDWMFTSISSVPAGFHNPGFGPIDSQLVDQSGGGEVLGAAPGPGDVATVTVTIELLSDAGDADMDDMFCNQVELTGLLGGMPVSDLSTDGTDPDPDGNGNPSEADPSCLMQLPVELMSYSIAGAHW